MFRSGHILQHETPIAKKKKGQMYIIRPVTNCLKIEHFRWTYFIGNDIQKTNNVESGVEHHNPNPKLTASVV
jgi:hypothetical protein